MSYKLRLTEDAFKDIKKYNLNGRTRIVFISSRSLPSYPDNL